MEGVLDFFVKELNNDSSLPGKVSNGEQFESYIFEKLRAEKEKGNIESVVHNGTHAFPDLEVQTLDKKKWGVEVKFSASGNWRSKGNSVYESLSNKATKEEEGYEEIYVLFGRKPKKNEDMNTYEVKYAPYAKAIDKIEVTHSPRFSINMNERQEKLFDAFQDIKGYEDFRKFDVEKKNHFIREYFKNITTEDEVGKWYVDYSSSDDSTGELEIQAIPFKSLKEEEKSALKAEAFILFPENLFRDKASYSNFTRHMINRHMVFDPSLRDKFSSGGKFLNESDRLRYPKIFKVFKDLQGIIKEKLRNVDESFETECHSSWKEQFGEEFYMKNLSENDSLEINYEKIIKLFTPYVTFEVKEGSLETSIKKYVNLSEFYEIEKL